VTFVYIFGLITSAGNGNTLRAEPADSAFVRLLDFSPERLLLPLPLPLHPLLLLLLLLLLLRRRDRYKSVPRGRFN